MPGQNLTRDEATARSATIKVHSYDIDLDLTGDDTTFKSISRIAFDAKPGGSTFIDLIADKVNRIELNGEILSIGLWKDSRIGLENLSEKNELLVEADCLYMHTGEGMHRFVDPADNEAYVYTQFEVPDARRVFAVFEQPDMKATFTFHVTVPDNWTVFSNSPTPTPTGANPGTHRFDFSPSEHISSYITAVVAGPYAGKTDSLTSVDGREIPLGVYSRKSLVKHLDADSIISVTKSGFSFFEKQYGIPYPFRKYDQIFVPEYNAGAMENAGCVTFRDEYIFRTKPTKAQVSQRVNTILHELAHMWFGDLVTMRWWNDLWLNESFAEYMSHLCAAEGTQWTDAWTAFGLRKDWGLNQDQLPTTHPIVAQIRDLADVEVNFDGITYAKGAAVLRQLVSYVGRDNFFVALRQYFNKHAWSNTQLSDLLEELETASGRDLTRWSEVWLHEAGVTLLWPRIHVTPDGKIASLAIEQKPFTPESSLRPHRLAVGGYNLSADGSVMERVFHTELDVDHVSTLVTKIDGIQRPDVILINDGDLAYAKIRLDDQSLDTAVANITKFTDPLTRATIVASAWDMTRDGEWSASKFINLILASLSVEDDSTMLMLHLRHLRQAIDSFTAPDHRAAKQIKVGDRLLRLARTASVGSDAQLQLIKAAAAHAGSKEALDAIEALYKGEESLAGLTMNVELKWQILAALTTLGRAGETEIAEMEKKDATMTGAQRATQCRAAIPNYDNKAAVFNSILHNADLSNDTRIALINGFWASASTIASLYESFIAPYFENLEQIWEKNTHHTAQTIVTSMYPVALAGSTPDPNAVVAAGKSWLDDHPNVSAALRRLVIERTDQAERALKCQSADTE